MVIKMRDTILGRIMMYVTLWIGLFLVLCVISVIKNWNVLAAIISGTISALIGYVFVIGLMIYGIAMIIGAGFR